MSRLSPLLAAAAAGALAATVLIAAPSAAVAAEASIRINEVESDGGTPGDWIEFFNAGSTAVELDGWSVKDNKDENVWVIPTGTSLAPGAFLVIDELKGGAGQFDFGLGKDDAVRLFDATGALVDERAWSSHAPTTYGVLSSGWGVTAQPTRGAANDVVVPAIPGSVRLSEVDSSPADWVELTNAGERDLDISGYELRDNSDDHSWRFTPGTVIAAGQFAVVDAGTVGVVGGAAAAFGTAIGIGSTDEIRLFDPAGSLVDRTGAWQGHAALNGSEADATLARCAGGDADFVLAHPTPGATNSCVMPDVAINEIESNGDATDWVEIINHAASPVDISGWSVMDNDPVGHAGEATPLPVGTVLAAGARFVFDGGRDFVFGLGNGDTVTLRDASGLTVDEHVYAAHADGVLARCPEGTGDLVDVSTSTKGSPNACGNPVRINEVESDGGAPDDWIELVNPTDAPLDVSGIVVKDDDDAHAYALPAGRSIAAGGYLVIDREQLGFGLGGGDRVRLFDGAALIDETSWGAGHAATTWGRCPDATGAFATTSEPTKGASNLCPGALPVGAWPGSAEVRVLDPAPTFLEDSSGLDVQDTADGAFLWAVDNGTGTFWKLAIAADGTTSFAPGWDQGKRARFIADAGSPEKAGPDAEGITVDGSGRVFLASERDNAAKGVNRNTILQVDPAAPGPDVVASAQWELNDVVPGLGAVAANVGLEAVEWVSDDDLAGALVSTTGVAYDPALYPGHGDGLFFVAVEDTGLVHALALLPGGEAHLVATLDPGLPGVMALDYDTVLGVLWAVCDNGCGGTAAQITLNGTASPSVAHVARPAGMPDLNNEGFATAPASLSLGGMRPAYWFADGFAVEALCMGSLPGGPEPTEPGNPGTEPGGPGAQPGLPGTGGGSPGVGVTPLPGDALSPENRGGVSAPERVERGAMVTVSVGVRHAGAAVEVWLYSTPQRIAAGTVDAAGAVRARIPADAPLGEHRLVVYAADGTLIGWAPVRIVAAGTLAATGTEAPYGGLGAAVALTLLGAAALVLRSRRRAS
ncbi:lamin tail domain-containing protein [Microbacterium sp. SORGH_AS_0862]|uniref:lamin tail domain-containing protein n=1 Tax=Microbacterium sp. SORGH_AS_0862 TaxID=3041789 RepID=UPI00278E6D99|nr:lamin tail domain-containing protein [Microbacterium sp. SORGH_AS_0862]MDQ1204378.1 hypothetical protein [Microbacterium sp. SORGH_AS_0862]